MARVTIENCVEQINNRFELVSLAAQRAKSINRGSPLTVEKDNDKNAVIALREIAAKNLDIKKLREELINSLQTQNKVDFPEDENLYAESQEAMVGEIDISDNSSQTVFNDEEKLKDLSFEEEVDNDFINNIVDEDFEG